MAQKSISVYNLSLEFFLILCYNLVMISSLPEIFRDVLWSYKVENLDIEKNKKTIIIQALNYGTLDHWRWLEETYGQGEIQNVLQELPKTALRKHVRKLVTLIFNTKEQDFNHALRSAN